MNDHMSPIPSEAEERLPPADSFSGKVSRGFLRRFPIWPVIDFISRKKVPVHKHTHWYMWGGIALFFFLVQIVTGILLMVYYRPGAPWQSVQRIVMEVPFGATIRSIHHWSANLMVLALFVHLFSTLFMKAYRPPREATWLVGVVLLALTLVFGFSGYLLPFDDLSFFATNVGLSEAEKIPLIGHFVADLARGGPKITTDTIGRFYLLHVVVLPLLLLGLISVHLLFVQIQSVSVPDSFDALPEEKKKYKNFFTGFLWNEIPVWLFLGVLLVALAAILPRELSPEADAFAAAPPGIKPEWYFMAQYQLLKLFPGILEWLGMAIMTLIPVYFVVLPLFDKAVPTDGLGRWTQRISGFLLILMIALTIWGYAS